MEDNYYNVLLREVNTTALKLHQAWNFTDFTTLLWSLKMTKARQESSLDAASSYRKVTQKFPPNSNNCNSNPFDAYQDFLSGYHG